MGAFFFASSCCLQLAKRPTRLWAFRQNWQFDKIAKIQNAPLKYLK
jgi:hypothetical protein